MIIGVCGFGSSGSSAVLDYIKEFSTTSVLDDVEFQLITYPDGIETLDLFLNDCISKYSSSDVALTRFGIYTKRLYRVYDSKTNGQFSKLTSQYIDDITQIKWNGYGATDINIYNSWFYQNIGIRLMKSRVIPRLERILRRQVNCYPVREIGFSVKPEKFIEITSEYLELLIDSFFEKRKSITVINQPFAANNPQKSFKYFDSPKAIVVDRDPRDMYLFAKKFLLHAGRMIPSDDVKTFVTYYKKLRDGMPYKSDPENVLVIHFEELVYDYENATKTIRDFCGLQLEDKVDTFLVPERSANNTKLFEKYLGYEEDIRYIEDNLGEYLFDYSKYKPIECKGGMFYGRSELNKTK